MRLGFLLQFTIIAGLSSPLYGENALSWADTAYDMATRWADAAPERGTRASQFGDAVDALNDLLHPSSRSVELTWANIEDHVRKAKRGYAMVRSETDDDFMRNLRRDPGAQLGKLGDAVRTRVSDLSLENARRALAYPVPRLPQTWH